MIDLGLSREKTRALIRTLSEPHMVGVEVRLLDSQHRPMGTLTDRILSGQVNIDTTADISRQLQLSFLDEDKAVKVDVGSGRPDIRRMVQVLYKVRVDGEWISIPVFTGPISQVSREGEVVTLEALGKESISLGPTWRSRTYAKGVSRVWVIRSLLRDLTGESKFQLPKGWPARTGKVISIKREDSVWEHAQRFARGLHSAQLFYDGRGVARLRRKPVRSSFTFSDGAGGMLLSIPEAEESTEIVNLVQVIGAVPKGKKSPLVASRVLRPPHPFSPEELGRNGQPRYLPETIEDDSLRTQKEVVAVANRRLHEIRLDEVLVSFDTLPMPLLEEGDLFTVDSAAINVTGRVSKMVIPLGHSGRSTMGYLAQASKRRK